MAVHLAMQNRRRFARVGTMLPLVLSNQTIQFCIYGAPSYLMSVKCMSFRLLSLPSFDFLLLSRSFSPFVFAKASIVKPMFDFQGSLGEARFTSRLRHSLRWKLWVLIGRPSPAHWGSTISLFVWWRKLFTNINKRFKDWSDEERIAKLALNWFCYTNTRD